MATGPRYFGPFRRKREGRTDYAKRLKLVISPVPRMVVRRTNRHFIVQLVVAEEQGDRTLVAANSAELAAFGYTGALSNTPAAYLTGVLFGARALKEGHDMAILDIGRATASKGGRVFAALKGAVDAGLDIPFSEDILPDEDRMMGGHIAKNQPEKSGAIVINTKDTAERIKKEVT
jgi:large subunit ribosomal protein L18